MKKIIMIYLLVLSMFITPITQISASSYIMDEDGLIHETPAKSTVSISYFIPWTNYNSVYLTWCKDYEWDRYTIYRATSKDGKYYEVATTFTEEITISGLVTGKTYYFKIRAQNPYGYFETMPFEAVPRLGETPTCNIKNGVFRWSPINGAHGYAIYRAKKGSYDYRKIGTTKECFYSVKKGYNYQMKAYRKVNGKYHYSPPNTINYY